SALKASRIRDASEFQACDNMAAWSDAPTVPASAPGAAIASPNIRPRRDLTIPLELPRRTLENVRNGPLLMKSAARDDCGIIFGAVAGLSSTAGAITSDARAAPMLSAPISPFMPRANGSAPDVPTGAEG